MRRLDGMDTQLRAWRAWARSWGCIHERLCSGLDSSWTSVIGQGQSFGPAAMLHFQLVTPTTAFEEVTEPAGSDMLLSVTNDAGVTWHTVYTGRTSTTNAFVPGPFEMPVTFADSLHGFGADGLPPTDLEQTGAFYATSDGGSTWTAESPPLPKGPLPCPTEIVFSSPTLC
ncbi:MAG: hypothetical protein ACRDYC_01095, partial [Acidimicrobiales bacterium]